MSADTATTDPRRITRRKFLRRAMKGSLLGGLGALGYAYAVEPHWIEIVRRRLPIARLPDALVGRTLVQISDLHVGEEVSTRYITNAVASVADLHPDLIAITGDFMTCYSDEQVKPALDVLRELPAAPLGRFAILGNHDYGSYWRQQLPANRISRGLQEIDIRVLRNEVADASGLQIAGFDDLYSKRCLPRETLEQLDKQQSSLVLCHNPDVADLPVWLGYRGWILAGHTHGGQCKLPGFGPLILPVRNKRYTSGEFKLSAHRRMYINRGLGYTRRVRFNCRPEITVFTLQREATV